MVWLIFKGVLAGGLTALAITLTSKIHIFPEAQTFWGAFCFGAAFAFTFVLTLFRFG